VLNFDRSTVKHALENTQNCCHQWLSGSSRVHPIPSWFKGALLLRGGEGKGTKVAAGVRGWEGEERKENRNMLHALHQFLVTEVALHGRSSKFSVNS